MTTTKKTPWNVEYSYYDSKTDKIIYSEITMFHDENEEPWGTILIKAIEEKWRKAKYRGDSNSITRIAANRI